MAAEFVGCQEVIATRDAGAEEKDKNANRQSKNFRETFHNPCQWVQTIPQSRLFRPAVE
jgi:hypothetical protein